MLNRIKGLIPKLRKNTLPNTDSVVSKLIIDRDYDVPEWVYDYVTERVVWNLFEDITKKNTQIIDKYLDSKNVKGLFDYIKNQIFFSDKFINNFISFTIDKDTSISILIFNEDEIKRLYELGMINNILHYIHRYILVEDLEESCLWMLKYTNLTEDELLWELDMKITSYEGKLFQRYDIIDKVRDLLHVNESYERYLKWVNRGFPTTHKYMDQVDVHAYLLTYRNNNWKGHLDMNILQYVEDRSALVPILYEIGDTLNQEAYVLINRIDGWVEYDILVDRILHAPSSVRRISDFGLLVELFDCHLNQELPMEIQKRFILDGGDIKTMFTEMGTLRNEASIIKSSDNLLFLLGALSKEDLNFLLNHSFNFVINIMEGLASLNSMVLEKLLDTLLEEPLDENLWNALNHHNVGTFSVHNVSIQQGDYRASLVRRIVTYLSMDNVFNLIPKSLMYIEPSVLYVTRYISDSNIQYIPVNKLVPYIREFIHSNEYFKFNLFYKGEWVSITKAIDDQFLIEEIRKYKKYGYICDMKNVDYKSLIELLARDLEEGA